MARIFPFRGIQYNQEKIKNLSDVMTPPYDVISKEEQDNFYKRHPNNIIRLILGQIGDTDTPKDNRYTRAAEYFQNWRAEGILAQSDTPTLYITAVDFPVNGEVRTRYGLIARVGLEPFEKKIILPHERTFSKVKSERFELMKTCQANFSPIFSLYSDGGNILDELIAAVNNAGQPQSDVLDDKGHRHRIWSISDASFHQSIQNFFTDKQLFIADGHHRYETALNYRDWLASKINGFEASHPANTVLMYLCGMNDPGLTVLPAHRLLLNVPPESQASLIGKAADFFEIKTYKNTNEYRPDFLSDLQSVGSNTNIGLCIHNDPNIYLMCLKQGVMDTLFKLEIPDALRHLDVTVLTRLIFMKLLEFDEKRLDNEKEIAYTSIGEQALDAATSGKCDMAFILNATSIEQVQNVANDGLIMPRKSTYFYPKVITGQVISALSPT
jgi:uncharacterized protein (DUF1015 family)